LQRTGNAPDSPVNAFLPARHRRELRRRAARLRQQKVEPRYKNLHSAEELAGIYERTAQRDEIREQGQRELQRISLELERIRKEKAAEVDEAMVTLVNEAARLAEERGADSEAAQRFRLMQFLGWFGKQARDHRRTPRGRFPRTLFPAADPSVEARYQLTATEVLDSLPPDEAVIEIPAEGTDSGQPRVFLRIGLGEASWVGSFEIGHMSVGTVSLMPDGKHLFVSAKGAGYIIDLKSRTLVETIGTEVAGVMMNHPRTVFLVDHNGMSLEAFGTSGRLWKTDTISFRGFRNTALTDTGITGEARHPSRLGWTPFAVDLATGEAHFGEAV
jgi:hypothetical protein